MSKNKLTQEQENFLKIYFQKFYLYLEQNNFYIGQYKNDINNLRIYNLNDLPKGAKYIQNKDVLITEANFPAFKPSTDNFATLIKDKLFTYHAFNIHFLFCKGKKKTNPDLLFFDYFIHSFNQSTPSEKEILLSMVSELNQKKFVKQFSYFLDKLKFNHIDDFSDFFFYTKKTLNIKDIPLDLLFTYVNKHFPAEDNNINFFKLFFKENKTALKKTNITPIYKDFVHKYFEKNISVFNKIFPLDSKEESYFNNNENNRFLESFLINSQAAKNIDFLTSEQLLNMAAVFFDLLGQTNKKITQTKINRSGSSFLEIIMYSSEKIDKNHIQDFFTEFLNNEIKPLMISDKSFVKIHKTRFVDNELTSDLLEILKRFFIKKQLEQSCNKTNKNLKIKI